MVRKLNDIMQPDHVVRVLEDGTIEELVRGVRAPELVSGCTGDGSILKEHEQAMVTDARHQGWHLLSGWTGQYSYCGVGMHPSEFIGGRLEEHIRETPGLWVVVVPSMLRDGEDYDGWVLAHREG
jgi:hypothetical protein